MYSLNRNRCAHAEVKIQAMAQAKQNRGNGFKRELVGLIELKEHAISQNSNSPIENPKSSEKASSVTLAAPSGNPDKSYAKLNVKPISQNSNSKTKAKKLPKRVKKRPSIDFAKPPQVLDSEFKNKSNIDQLPTKNIQNSDPVSPQILNPTRLSAFSPATTLGFSQPLSIPPLPPAVATTQTQFCAQYAQFPYPMLQMLYYPPPTMIGQNYRSWTSMPNIIRPPF